MLLQSNCCPPDIVGMSFRDFSANSLWFDFWWEKRHPILLTQLPLDNFCCSVCHMMTVHTEQDDVMTAVALPLYREVTPITGRNNTVSEVVTCLTAGYTFILLAVQVIAIHTSLLVACLVHEAQSDGGRIIADAICQPPVLQNQTQSFA